MIPPVRILSRWMKQYPLAARQTDMLRSDFDIKWDREKCFLPIAGAVAIVTKGCPIEEVPMEAYQEASKIAALLAWRPTQRIYSFEPQFAEALIKSSLKKIPVEALFHMPEWCCYLDFEALDLPRLPSKFKENLTGAWIHLEYDVNLKIWELRIVALLEGVHLMPMALDLRSDDLEECIEMTIERTVSNMIKAGRKDWHIIDTPKRINRPFFEICLNLLLYLCSDQPDIIGPEISSKPKPKKTKKGYRLFPPKHPSEFACGYRIGTALKEAKSMTEKGKMQSARRSPIGHIRRAHWHTFRYGPGKKKTKVRWLPPIPVKLDLDKTPIPTIIPVGSDRKN